MTLVLVILINLSILSIALNIYFLFKFRSLKKKRPQSIELREFLTDILSGPALLEVNRIDPQSIFVHNPEGRL